MTEQTHKCDITIREIQARVPFSEKGIVKDLAEEKILSGKAALTFAASEVTGLARRTADPEVRVVPAKDLNDLQQKLRVIREEFWFEVNEVTAEIGTFRFELRRNSKYSGWVGGSSHVVGMLGYDAIAINTYVSASSTLHGIAVDSTIRGNTTVAEGAYISGRVLLDDNGRSTFVGRGVRIEGPLEIHGETLQMPGVITAKNLAEYLKGSRLLSRMRRKEEIRSEASYKVAVPEQLPIGLDY